MAPNGRPLQAVIEEFISDPNKSQRATANDYAVNRTTLGRRLAGHGEFYAIAYQETQKLSQSEENLVTSRIMQRIDKELPGAEASDSNG